MQAVSASRGTERSSINRPPVGSVVGHGVRTTRPGAGGVTTRRIVASLVTGLLFTVAAASTATDATAEPGTRVQRLERRIIRLQYQVDAATERYNQTREGIKSAQMRLRAAQVRVTEQQQQVQLARESLACCATSTDVAT